MLESFDCHPHSMKSGTEEGGRATRHPPEHNLIHLMPTMFSSSPPSPSPSSRMMTMIMMMSWSREHTVLLKREGDRFCEGGDKIINIHLTPSQGVVVVEIIRCCCVAERRQSGAKVG